MMKQTPLSALLCLRFANTASIWSLCVQLQCLGPLELRAFSNPLRFGQLTMQLPIRFYSIQLTVAQGFI